MTGSIEAELAGEPPRVLLSPSNVPAGVWYEIELLPGAEREGGGAVSLPAESLLQNRRRLFDLLLDSQTTFRPSDAVRDLVNRSTADDRAFAVALGRTEDEDALDLDAALADGPYELIRDLRDFQVENLGKLAALAHGANFSVPGAGKTTVAYALHALQRSAGRVNKLLVVAPLSAYGAWEEDAVEVLSPAPRVVRMTGPTVPNGDVVLVNYQRLPQALAALSGWATRHQVHLVVDEAHRAKRGAAGEWGRALMALAPLAVRRDILTGTPAPNHPRDLVALLDFLWPSRRASQRIPRAALRPDPSNSAIGVISSAIAPFFVRTNKAQLNIPEATIRALPVEMGPLQAAIYEALRNRYAGTLDVDVHDRAAFARMGEVTMYLLQAASSPRLLRTSADPARAYRFPPLAIPPGSRLAQMLEDYADHEVPAKVEAVSRIVAANADAKRKTLVWSNFPDNLLDLQQQLAGLQPAIVYGGIPSVDEETATEGQVTREREIERFRNDDACKVLLANPAALSEGVSLHHHCNDAVYMDRTFNAGQYLQSLDRIHRLGLEDDTITNITILTATGTIDEHVNRRVQVKAERLGDMLADENLSRMALPDEEDGVVFLDDERDLAELLAHLGAPYDED